MRRNLPNFWCVYVVALPENYQSSEHSCGQVYKQRDSTAFSLHRVGLVQFFLYLKSGLNDEAYWSSEDAYTYT